MKTQEDNFIKSRLDSLNTLPPGYTPNIASKWTLIQESIDERKSERLALKKILFRIAACLLIIIISTAIWMKSGNENVIADRRPQQEVKQSKKVTGRLPESLPSQVTDHVAVDKSPANRIKRNISVAQEKVIQENAAEIPSVSEDRLNSEVVAADPVRVNRQRYVQVDFEEQQPVQQITANETAQAFSIKFSLANRPQAANTQAKIASRLRITRNF